MKNLIMTFAAAVGLSLGSFAQSATAESKAFRSSQIVAPYDIEVTYNKTVHVLFPAAVQYVDLGSNDIIAGRASGAENVVRIKSLFSCKCRAENGFFCPGRCGEKGNKTDRV